MKRIYVTFSVPHNDSLEKGLQSNELTPQAKLHGLVDFMDEHTITRVVILEEGEQVEFND